MTESVFKHIVRNSDKNVLAVVVEPWGRVYDVPPGSVLQLDVYESAPYSIESEQKKDVTVIWLSGGGRATVSVDETVFPPDLN